MHTQVNGRITHVAGLMLAAGVSRRFGSDKRQATLDSGKRLLEASLEVPCAVLAEVLVVLRKGDDPTALGLPATVQCVFGEQSGLGMGHSLASGVQRLIEVSRAEAVAIFLGDMPWLDEASLQQLLVQASAERIVLPVSRGQQGHPVIFGRQFWPELSRLTGDSGARGVVKAHPNARLCVELDAYGLVADVDTPQALRQGPGV
ncbi:NTP transferase domain-containing protein [Pseudomonas sp. CC6-YY-74]|uniref:nucleotidyltransferase family protein n=1 Tax=Pseudomonas sp. CC6-YY-74 TaxID=1930532 RepID=UPI0021158617|nr:nucleotidyltransferase family protein [Pseudomonas sp. CC6-YY-74]